MISEPMTGSRARKKILAGVNKVYETVRLTIGPEGKNALLPRTFNRGPRITNDGITIMENCRLRDEHESLAAEAFKEGSKKTNELAGDGTTTTAVIAGALINVIFNELPSDTPMIGDGSKTRGVRALRKEMNDAKAVVVEEIKKRAKPIKTQADLDKIAIVSIGKEDEATAKIVSEMVWNVGRDASGSFIDNYIDVVEGYKGEIETEIIKGMRFPAKVPAKVFVNKPERFEMVVEDTAVFITTHKLDNPPLLAEAIGHTKATKLTIFAPEFSTAVLRMFDVNTKKGMVHVYPVHCPALRTEQLEDLAVYTGAKVIDKAFGGKLENVTAQDLGYAEKIVVKDTENREDAVLLGGKSEKIKRGTGNPVTDRCEVLKKQLDEAKNDMLKKSLERRIANLSSAVGVIRVGASTSGDGLYLKLKIEDGVYACKAALQEGYVVGGGLCLKDIAEKLPENILTSSLKAPSEQIQKNAGGNLEISKDIIDPAKVVRLEVEHGVSIAAIMGTLDISIPEERDKNPVEGYEAIARAINTYAMYDARHKGLIKSNEDFAEEERNREFERVIDGDKG